MQYIVDDEVVVETSISTDSTKVDVDVMTGEQVTCDTELVVAGTSLSTDLIIEETKVDDIAVTTPYGIISNEETPVVTPLQVLDYGSSSIEVSFEATTQEAEEVVRGVLCGTTNPPTFENADYRLLHGQGSMDLAFAGLENNTEYYLRPYALSNLGYKYGDVVAQRTKNSPIPDEYQLVEYLEGDNAPYINLQYIAKSYSGVLIRAKIHSHASATFGQAIGNRFGFSFTYSGGTMVAQYGNTYHIVSVQSVLNAVCNWTFNYLNDTYIGCNDNKISTPAIPEPSQNNLYLFCVNVSYPTEFAKQTIYYAIITENQDFVKKLYPVYRKSDSKPGMYDIINNVFYVNQGTGEFTVGPDKEWEE